MDSPAGSSLTKFMADRKKLRRNSIANLKKIIADVKEEGSPGKAQARRASTGSTAASAPLSLDVRNPSERSSETSDDAGAPPSILDTYAMKMPPTPRKPDEDQPPKQVPASAGAAPPSPPPKASPPPPAPPRHEAEEDRQEQRQSAREETKEPKEAREVRRVRFTSTGHTRPRANSVEGDDPVTILKKYAKKSKEVFELNHKLGQVQRELNREREKAGRIQQNYDTLFAQKAQAPSPAPAVAPPPREDPEEARARAAEVSTLTRKLSLAEQELVHAKTEYIKLHSQYLKTLQSFEQQQQQQGGAGGARPDAAELAASLELAEQENRRLRSELEGRSAELGNMREELAILREFRERVFHDQSEKGRLRGMLQKHASDLMEKDAQVSFLEGQLGASRNENKKLREDYGERVKLEGHKQVQIDELTRDSDILRSKVDQYKKKEEMENQLRQELQNLAVDLSAKHEQNKRMLQQISEREQVFEGRQDMVEALQKELALARNALQQSELEKGRALQQKTIHQEELFQLREEAGNMAKAKKQLGQLSKAFESLPVVSTLATARKTASKPHFAVGAAAPAPAPAAVAAPAGYGHGAFPAMYGGAARNLSAEPEFGRDAGFLQAAAAPMATDLTPPNLRAPAHLSPEKLVNSAAAVAGYYTSAMRQRDDPLAGLQNLIAMSAGKHQPY